MNMNPKTKQTRIILLILAIGALLAALILLTKKPQGGNEHGHEKKESVDSHNDEANTQPKGLHGGKLFIKDGYGVEVTIFEQGTDPQFRLYTYQGGTPLDPASSIITLTLERLGRKPQLFAFTKEKDYLKGNAVVEEPHSFNVKISAEHAGKTYHFTYEQVEARVTLTEQQAKESGIVVQTVGPAQIKTTLQLIGEIHYNEDKMVHIVPRLAGIVESVAANAGDKVRKGQVLAVISSQELADQRSALLAAQKRYGLAKSTYDRERKLWQEKISAEQDYLQAQKDMQEAQIILQSAQQKLSSIGGSLSGSSLTRYEVRAPIDGTVTEKRIATGQSLKEDANIFVVADLSTVWVELTVPAKEMNAVKTGQTATVKATSFDASAVGTVSYIGALVGEQTRTAKARVVLPNPKGTWRPGLPVNIELVADEIQVPVAVLNEAIQTLRDWSVVFGRYGEQFEARPIKLGRTDGRYTEVLDGLRAGELYAAGKSFVIKAELGKAGASHDH